MKTGTTFIVFLTTILTLAAGSALAYSGGSGTTGDPYQIATKADLLALAANTGDYNNCFILTADIDMGGQVFTTAIIAANTSSSTGFQGTTFTGTFDGNGHKITGFTINGGNNSYIGLFGTNSGSVKNLGLEDFVVVSGYFYVGGLVGENWGSISNCYSTGTVSGGSGSEGVGGLVGSNYGNVSNCYSTGKVSGLSGVGGLVGENLEGNVSNCYSTGKVSGFSDVGGLVGLSFSGSISNCYSMGSVSGTYSVGGLVGENETKSAPIPLDGIGAPDEFVGGSISNCYSTGTVSGSSNVGGLVGGNNGGSIVSSFWDINTSGLTTSAGGTGETTAQMKTESTFTSAGWDFTTIWRIRCEGMNYPKLNWQVIPTADWVCPDGVDFADFAYFAEWWRTIGCNSSNNFCGGTDMDYSGTVDIQDLAIFAENWLSGE
ncbi:MAG: GLUG motif-containing protein [Sedimentisphaerales bacterium]